MVDTGLEHMGYDEKFYIHWFLGHNRVDLVHEVVREYLLPHFEVVSHSHRNHHSGILHSHNHKQNPERLLLLVEQCFDFSYFSSLSAWHQIVLKQFLVVIGCK
jgi:hypothetical protein